MDRRAEDLVQPDEARAIHGCPQVIENRPDLVPMPRRARGDAEVAVGEILGSVVAHIHQACESNLLSHVKGRPAGDDRYQGQPNDNTLVLELKEIQVVITMEATIDLDAERKRLQKEIEQSQAELARLEARLEDREFLTKAPSSIIDKERQKLYSVADKLERLRQQILKY